MSSGIDITVHNDSTLRLRLVYQAENAGLIRSKKVYLPISSKSIQFMFKYQPKILYLFIDCIDSQYTPTDYEIILERSNAEKNILLSSAIKQNPKHIGCVELKLNGNPPLIVATFLIKFKNGIKLNKHIHLYNRVILLSGLSTESPDDYYDKGIGLDFSIMINKEIIKASKYVLGLHSPVFKAMFENNWKDSRENLITIEDIEYDAMLLFVKALHSVPVYLYNINMALQLIVVADKYNVDEIKQQAKHYVKGEINKDNAINILTLAHNLNIEDMKREAVNFMTSRKYGKIEELQGWDQMPSDIAVLILNETRNKLP